MPRKEQHPPEKNRSSFKPPSTSAMSQGPTNAKEEDVTKTKESIKTFQHSHEIVQSQTSPAENSEEEEKQETPPHTQEKMHVNKHNECFKNVLDANEKIALNPDGYPGYRYRGYYDEGSSKKQLSNLSTLMSSMGNNKDGDKLVKAICFIFKFDRVSINDFSPVSEQIELAIATKYKNSDDKVGDLLRDARLKAGYDPDIDSAVNSYLHNRPFIPCHGTGKIYWERILLNNVTGQKDHGRELTRKVTVMQWWPGTSCERVRSNVSR